MKVVFAADHAGFALKNELVLHVRELGYDVDDLGALELNLKDDYPAIIARAAREVSKNPGEIVAIIVGASGQGEAMVANRHSNVRAAVYYGEAGKQTDASGQTLDIIESVRQHNHANVLSLGARFVTSEQAKKVVKRFLETPHSANERHIRRVSEIEKYSNG